jgi:lipopolysaccharide export system protein LptA
VITPLVPGRLLLSAIVTALLLVPLVVPGPAFAQSLDFSHGGPISITASNGIEWRQKEQEVVAQGNARAVRGNVTVTADRLVAWYRKKGGGTAAQPAESGITGAADTGGNEIYRVRAEGNVHIFTQTDQAQGDRATYDLDQSVLVMTGRHLRLTTPDDVLTARDTLEYWSQKHMAVARGDAVVVTRDARRLAADTLVAYMTDAQQTPGQQSQGAKPASGGEPAEVAGKLERVEAYGHVSVRTPSETVTGDRGVYVPATGIARLAGQVRITRGQNQLNGSEADVNMKTGVARLLSGTSNRVQGLVVPNDQTNRALGNDLDGGSQHPAGGKP